MNALITSIHVVQVCALVLSGCHSHSDGYAIAYGLKYCDAFTEAQPNFTYPKGQEWVCYADHVGI